VSVTLLIQHAKRMRRIVWSFCPVWLCHIFPHYLINGTIIGGKKMLLDIKCVFWFWLQILSEIFLMLRKTERDVIKMYIGLHVKYPLFLSDFNATWIFATDILKKTQISNFMKIRPVETELFHADGRTDMTELLVTFRNFANAPINGRTATS